MDSKSIAREGVPVRLRDPVLNPDETFGFVGFFYFLALLEPFSRKEGAVRRGNWTRRNKGNGRRAAVVAKETNKIKKK